MLVDERDMVDHREPPAETGEYAIPAPAVSVEAPRHGESETPEEKRTRFMAALTYKDSAAHQAAALTWAVVEVRDELRRGAEAAERANQIAEAALREQRSANLLAFYSANPISFPPGVREQIAAALDIKLG